jgi:thiol:disulfide interchange protein DsbD
MHRVIQRFEKAWPIVLVLGLLAPAFFTEAMPGGGNPPPRKISLYTKLLNDSSIFTIKLDPKESYFPGKTFTAHVHVHHANHWHLYSSTMSPDAGPTPLRMAIPDDMSDKYTLVGLKEWGKKTSVFDSNFSATTISYYGDFDIDAQIKIKKGVAVGTSDFGLQTSYMTCSESTCLPSRTYAIPMTFLGQKPVTLKIVETPKDSLKALNADTAKESQGIAPVGNAGSNSGSNTPTTTTPSATVQTAPTPQTGPVDPNAVVKLGWLEFILAAAGCGLLALVTPCVYPMVPITISFFTKRNAGSRKEAVKDATLYSFGIILTFLALGLLLTLLFGRDATKIFATNPIANLVLAIVFIFFALNLFGMYEIGIPASVLTKLNSVATTSKNRWVSVMVMGFVFSLASFTCTMPFVSTLMFTFSQGSVLRPLVGMLVYSSVFSLPFFFLALFPKLLSSMPRSGGWMNSVKVVMGFVELGLALKYIANIDMTLKWGFFSRDLVLSAWVALAILTTVYLLGRFRMAHDSPIEHIGALRAVFAVLFLSFGIYLYTGLNGHPLGQLDAQLPLAETSTSSASMVGSSGQASTGATQVWYKSYNQALAEAKKTHKNIFIDFTGYTCTNCRAMESTVFNKPDVQDIFKDYVLARLYTDDNTPLSDSNRDMEENRFSTIALPFYVILSPEDKPLNTFPGYTPDREAFKTFLNQHRKSSGSVAMASN